jgi:integrase
MAHVKDLWFTSGARGPKRKTAKHPDRGGDKAAKRYLAVWNMPGGAQPTKAFDRKIDAERYAAAQETDAHRGVYQDPNKAKITVGQWCDTWLLGYRTRRPSTVRQAQVHIKLIKAEFGAKTVASIRPSHVKTWTARLTVEGYAPSYVFATYRRLCQIMTGAVEDGLRTTSPCSRKTSPGRGSQRAFCATTEQVWQLYGAMPPYLQIAVLLGAMGGLRLAETCGLRPGDVDLVTGMLNPAVQYPAQPLKSETSRTAVPIPGSLITELITHSAQWSGDWVLVDDDGRQIGPWRLERAIRKARDAVDGLPEGFRYHDLRHYLASLLIASGADVKKVQARMRHASAKTTLDVYGHLWPDTDETTNAALEAVFAARTEL